MDSRSQSNSERRFVVGLSGASGVIYGVRLVESMLRIPEIHVELIITNAGFRVLRDEVPAQSRVETDAGPWAPYFKLTADESARVHYHPNSDIGAAPASGTFLAEAMIVAPCSMNTLGCIAHGLQPNLLTRAAAVTLKEGRPLLLVPRETPLSLIDMRNLTTAAEAGAVILPASPGFYHDPKSIDDLVNFVVQKMMDRLGLDVSNAVRWTG
jgi:4-hydroxy-3-polyprenylbenzoate decarboxylase